MKKVIMLIAAFAAAPVFPAMADSSCTDDCVKRMTTDFSGRPPFKRSFEMVPASEIRAEEAAKAAAKAKKPKFLGTPPYKNRIRTIGR